MSKKKYYIVSEDALPDIFIKVAEAKRMLQVGEAKNVGEAARLMNISRSAFYKYKDAVFPYDAERSGSILTLHLILRDRPGVLSSVLSSFAAAGVNILTVNQNIPAGGVASVSISAVISRSSCLDLPSSSSTARARFCRYMRTKVLRTPSAIP